MVCQLVNRVVHVVTLTVEVFVDACQLAVGSLKLIPKLGQLVRLEVKLILKGLEVLRHLFGLLFLFLEFHLELSLLLLFLGELLPGLLEFLLLGFGHLHDLITDEHLLLHLLELLHELLLLRLRLLFHFLLLLKLLDQPLLFFLLQVGLVVDSLAFGLRLDTDVFLLLGETLLKLFHLGVIFHEDLLLHDSVSTHHAVHFHDFSRVFSLV